MKLDDETRQTWKGNIEPGGPLERAFVELESIPAPKGLQQQILRKEFSSTTSHSYRFLFLKFALPACALVLFFLFSNTPDESKERLQVATQATLSETDLVELAYFIEDITLDEDIYLEDVELGGDEWLLVEETL
ncbi:MAG: hypothetical protein KDD55_12885 [Bdellovibrionales bacterium]|nr:hypothetical protein [Bdellovibrionales bacterium]